MSALRIGIAVATLFLAPSLAHAQGGASCKDGTVPFRTSAANQITGAALQTAVTGKRLRYVRESIRVPGV